MGAFIAEYGPYLAALLPSFGVGYLFYWIIRYMIEADRSERKAMAKWNAEHGDNVKGNRQPLTTRNGPVDD